MIGRKKIYVFTDENIVIFYCPRINSCRSNCSTFRKYARLGYDIVCLNTSYYKEREVSRILREEIRRRSGLKNRLGS